MKIRPKSYIGAKFILAKHIDSNNGNTYTITKKIGNRYLIEWNGYNNSQDIKYNIDDVHQYFRDKDWIRV